MKILFFEPYALSRPHFDVALDLVQKHLDQGDEVDFFYCAGSLHSCEANKNHYFFTCVDCISRRLAGLKLLDQSKGKLHTINFLKLSSAQRKMISDWRHDFKSIEEVKAYQLDGVDIGMSVASSFISYLRDAEPDLVQHGDTLKRLFKASLSVYHSFKNHLTHQKPDLLYIFNGRFSNLRPVIRICEQRDIPYIVHEQGSSKNKYGLFDNHLPHSPSARHLKILAHWETEKEEALKVDIATKFFLQRREGIEHADKAMVRFPDDQGMLPDYWDSNKRNVVIFNSSDDEFAAVGREFFNPLFGKQIEVLKMLREKLKHDSQLVITLRMHPNLKGVDNSLVKETKKLAGDNFQVIFPDSKVNSYHLIDAADAVLTFGSTTGVEAVFANKASILVGNAIYRELNCTYNPDNPAELIDMLRKVEEPKPVLGALMYAFYRATFGEDFKYYEPINFSKGKFKGEVISSSAKLNALVRYKIPRIFFRMFYYTKPVG